MIVVMLLACGMGRTIDHARIQRNAGAAIEAIDK
jgi:hypothetical protein